MITNINEFKQSLNESSTTDTLHKTYNFSETIDKIIQKKKDYFKGDERENVVIDTLDNITPEEKMSIAMHISSLALIDANYRHEGKGLRLSSPAANTKFRIVGPFIPTSIDLVTDINKEITSLSRAGGWNVAGILGYFIDYITELGFEKDAHKIKKDYELI